MGWCWGVTSGSRLAALPWFPHVDSVVVHPTELYLDPKVA